MPKRTDIKTILVLGSGPIVIGQGCEFDYSGTQACKALKAEGYRIVLVNSNPATIMTDPAFSDRTYIEPITPEAVRKIIEKECCGAGFQPASDREPRGAGFQPASDREPCGAGFQPASDKEPCGAGFQPASGAPQAGAALQSVHASAGPQASRGIDAILPTLGGQTALNCACALWDDGTLQKHGIEMIGANREVIHRAEDREQFRRICEGLGLKMPPSRTVTNLDDALEFLKLIGLPAIVRPAFTLGGTGGGIAYNAEEFRDIVARGLAASMIGQVQVDQSIIGWKEYELEVIRDRNDNCIVVCGIENIDPMGVHTGDSITVAPILTLTDKEYQALRDAAFAIMRAVGVETGGSNVQFAVNPAPRDGKFEFVVVEMNPRVSRSSALASKATGFPIAKVAARLAVGYSLDELRNDVTGTTSACFEPAIDYIVVKMPRWTFEKFPEADETLTTQMKSVGEAMAIGRTFKEAFQKAIRSMEVKRFGLGLDRNDRWLAAMRAVGHGGLVLDIMGGPLGGPPLREGPSREPQAAAEPRPTQQPTLPDGDAIEWPIPLDKLTRKLAVPCQGRPYYIRYALKMGWSVEKISQFTKIDPFFIAQLAELVAFEDVLCSYRSLEDLPREVLLRAKQYGYSDAQLANLYLGTISSDTILRVRAHRKRAGVEPVYKLVDTCAAEFEAATPYYYSTYETGWGEPRSADRDGCSDGSRLAVRGSLPEDEVRVSDRAKVVIIGGGPNRIGQGIEFDYCCVQAAFAARELGFESVMINSNPETVSTDYDTSDLLFFEPLTLEDTLNVIERLNGRELRSGQRAERQGGQATPDPAHSAASPPGRSAAPGLVRGVVVQFGGQTPLNLAHGLVKAGAPIIGTSVDSIDLAEDRDRFDALLERLHLRRPPSGIARSLDEAAKIAGTLGYPVLVRPSYVLGGRGMEICSDERSLRHFMTSALKISEREGAPILIDKFLDDATEVDVDVIADFESEPPSEPPAEAGGDRPLRAARPPAPAGGSERRAVVCGVLEHIEQAGIHSGDSACTIPAWSLRPALVERIRTISRRLARELAVNGLMNVQMAIKDDEIYILEVNPRASRTAPFVSKAKHTPFPLIAAKVMMGRTLDELGVAEAPDAGAYAVKEPVFPFNKFPGVDVVLGPEMRSTGEVMGFDPSLPLAYAKAKQGAGVRLPTSGGVFISVRERDRQAMVDVARSLLAMGFTVYATEGTAAHLQAFSLRPRVLQKIATGARPNVLDLMQSGEIHLVINTPTRTGWKTDEGRIRATAVRLGLPMITTATAATVAVRAIEALRAGDWGVAPLQEHREAARLRALPGRRLAAPPLAGV